MLSNNCTAYLLFIHQPFQSKIIHIYDHSDLNFVWYWRTTITVVSILHYGPSFGKVTYKLITPVRIFHISVFLTDDSNWEKFKANSLNVHKKIVFANRRNGLLGEQLKTTITIYFGYTVTLHFEIIFKVFVELVDCNMYLFSKHLSLEIL
jgi:hypothetical protein